MPPIINKNQCNGCMTCVTVCPVDAFGHQQKDAAHPVVNFPDECWHCNSCVLDCPTKACTLRVPLPDMMVFVDAPKKDS